MSKPIFVLNGPNLNRLGTREPALYGTTTLAEIEALCRRAAGKRPLVFRQSNAEHELIGWIHEAVDAGAALVINPAGLSFTSVALLDAIRMVPGPVIEVHLTNIHRREPPHRTSLVSLAATGVICGLGPEGYRAAIAAAIALAG
jgi:3-dehydroquinate dehydratase II